jgi:CHAT domain-containing protein
MEYLVEHRTLKLAPSVLNVAVSSANGPDGRLFAAIADPIYNAADSRLSPEPQRADMLGWFSTAGRPSSEMARLPGSMAELEAAVGALRPLKPILLTGGQVNRQAFLSVLDRRVNILHLATHVVTAPGDSRQALIALGLNSRTRDQDLVGADEIIARRNGARLVIMSGCGSGNGEVLPGAGVLSLTRAWILAGTSGVVASHWPVTDHSGALFERFYQHASTRSDAAGWARALQQAQIESIRHGIPASVWAAYFFTGRN